MPSRAPTSPRSQAASRRPAMPATRAPELMAEATPGTTRALSARRPAARRGSVRSSAGGQHLDPPGAGDVGRGRQPQEQAVFAYPGRRLEITGQPLRVGDSTRDIDVQDVV